MGMGARPPAAVDQPAAVARSLGLLRPVLLQLRRPCCELAGLPCRDLLLSLGAGLAAACCGGTRVFVAQSACLVGQVTAPGAAADDTTCVPGRTAALSAGPAHVAAVCRGADNGRGSATLACPCCQAPCAALAETVAFSRAAASRYWAAASVGLNTFGAHHLRLPKSSCTCTDPPASTCTAKMCWCAGVHSVCVTDSASPQRRKAAPLCRTFRRQQETAAALLCWSCRGLHCCSCW